MNWLKWYSNLDHNTLARWEKKGTSFTDCNKEFKLVDTGWTRGHVGIVTLLCYGHNYLILAYQKISIVTLLLFICLWALQVKQNIYCCYCFKCSVLSFCDTLPVSANFISTGHCGVSPGDGVGNRRWRQCLGGYELGITMDCIFSFFVLFKFLLLLC